MAHERRIALVTGANKGIGFEVSRQLGKLGITVVVGARDSDRCQNAVAALRGEGIDAHPLKLDTSVKEEIFAGVDNIRSRFGGLDILVNNAGILVDGADSAVHVGEDKLRATLDTNVIGPFLLCQAVVPMMKEQNYGRIVNVSSTLGSLYETADPNSSFAAVLAPAYRISKAALNSVTVIFAKEVRGSNVLINSACPGWVKTDMGSQHAPLSVEEGADTPVWLATLPDGGPNGKFFNSRRERSW